MLFAFAIEQREVIAKKCQSFVIPKRIFNLCKAASCELFVWWFGVWYVNRNEEVRIIRSRVLLDDRLDKIRKIVKKNIESFI